MQKEDISIGYEIWAKPELGIEEAMVTWSEATPLPDFFPFRKKFWNPVDEYSLVGEKKGYYIHKLAKKAMKLPGDFVEFGCYRGGLSYMLGLMVQDFGVSKRVFMHDNFDKGLPGPDRTFDKAYFEGTMSCPIKTIHESISKLDLGSQCIPKAGLFSETLGDYDEDQRFALVHIDCDLYHGAMECLEFVYPRIVDGVPVIMDDYYDESHGVMMAMNEFAEKHGIVIHLSTPCQAYWIMGERPEDTDAKQVNIDGNIVWLSTDIARNDPGLLPYMELMLKDRLKRADHLRNFIDIVRSK